ncbi:MAG: RHS repeat-associated core domain-containing protein [Chloroflexota bacterium]
MACVTKLGKGRGTAITTYVFDPMSNATSRTDQAISSTASSFTYDWRGNELTATSPTYSGTSSLGWRLDGLVASRTWPTGTNAATFAYDRAKRPTTLTEKYSGSNQAVFSQAYDRSGSVTSEGRTLTGVSGVAGTGTQSFTYDSLRRVTGSSISGGPTMTFGYDANSNRTSWNDGTASTTYDYNESDELTAQHRSGVDRTYAYDVNGNMTSSAVAGSGATTYTYDALDHLLSLTPPSGGALTYTLDALGRHWTKSVGGTLAETYGYIGASESVDRIDLSSGSVNAAVDAIGNRMATSTSAGGFGWLLPDLHGNVAGALGSNGSAVSDAFRYSAYGTSIGASTSSLPSPWRFQGRLALNSDDGSGNNTDLYDFVTRSYDPNLAAFTSLDSVAGGAQNPLTLNRFLYALASPATLVDPNGHYTIDIGDANAIQAAIAQNKNRFAIDAYKARQAAKKAAESKRVAAAASAVSRAVAAAREEQFWAQALGNFAGMGSERGAFAYNYGATALQRIRSGRFSLGQAEALHDIVETWNLQAAAFHDDSGRPRLVRYDDLFSGDQLLSMTQHSNGDLYLAFAAIMITGAGSNFNNGGSSQLGAIGELHLGPVPRKAPALTEDGPDFVAHPNGSIAVIPTGAKGPSATRGRGFQFEGGQGGNGLSNEVTGVRFMDPTDRYPSGYVVYMKRTQGVDPYTGAPIANDHLWRHMPW